MCNFFAIFASLMGDLSYEYQDAVIAANYVTKEQWDKQFRKQGD